MLHRLFVDRAEIVAVALCGVVFTGWNAVVSRSVSLPAFGFFLLLSFACFRVGRIILAYLALELPDGDDLPTRFAVGFLAVTAVLCLAFLVFPWNAGLTGTALLVLAAAACVGWKWRQPPESSGDRQPVAGLLCILLALLGASAWSRDALTCVAPLGETTILKPFGDSFAHAYFVSRLGFPEVPRDYIQTSGEPMGAYHFGAYAVPAAIVRVSTTSPFQAYHGIQVPLGLFLAGISAFSLVKTWWGSWPGLAGAAMLVVPDAAWLGIQNYWFSFHWTAVLSAGVEFGIACVAVSWILMFRGCQLGRPLLLLLSFFGLALCILFKAHIFVANAFLLWMYPSLFMRAWSGKRRLIWALFAMATFWTAIYLSQFSSRVPDLWPDGSAIKVLLPIYNQSIELEPIRERCLQAITPTTSTLRDLCLGVPILWLTTFGAFGALWIGIALLFGKRLGLVAWCFPWLVAINFALMFFGLPLSKKGLGEPDEMLHRPFVWAFFVVAAWAGGAAYFLVFGNSPPKGRLKASVLVCLLLGAMLVPLCTKRAIHQGPASEWTPKYCWFRVPTGFVACCQYLWENSHPADVIQDSQIDRYMMAAGLAGRRSFASGITFPHAPASFKDRVAQVQSWQEMQDEASIREFAAQRGIDWLIVHPGDMAQWPEALMGQPAFESGGFRLYRFASSDQRQETGTPRAD